MIGAFARMIGARDRILQVEESPEKGYSVRVSDAAGMRETQGHDAPPERFVERISDEGGDVYMAPLVEALRGLLGRRRSEARDATVPSSSEKR